MFLLVFIYMLCRYESTYFIFFSVFSKGHNSIAIAGMAFVRSKSLATSSLRWIIGTRGISDNTFARTLKRTGGLTLGQKFHTRVFSSLHKNNYILFENICFEIFFVSTCSAFDLLLYLTHIYKYFIFQIKKKYP